ncbi:hypothetical protein [Embleya sp. AB8]|uniref:hypothetical protein n=1 Tax=Embleya sp. AB8 TaxID=3156304 RepID=UPI003C70E101
MVVTIDRPCLGGVASGGRTPGRRSAIGCSDGGVTTGAVVGGVLGGSEAGGVARTGGGGVGLATTTATGVGRATGGGEVVCTGVDFGGGVGVADGFVGGRHDPFRTSRKSTLIPIPPVGGPVAVLTSTRTPDPGDPPIDTQMSTLVPGEWPPPPLDPAHATPAGATNAAPTPTTHPHRRARPHALMARIFRAIGNFSPISCRIHS